MKVKVSLYVTEHIAAISQRRFLSPMAHSSIYMCIHIILSSQHAQAAHTAFAHMLCFIATLLQALIGKKTVASSINDLLSLEDK